LAEKTPGEVLFIDDDLKNVKQARKIGLNSHHFISTEPLKQKMRKLGLSFLKDDST
jgi:FMN phosphatase YigB (HAD superfamily)